MSKQKIKLRVVIKNADQDGLYWHAEFKCGELYYGFTHHIGEVLRGSYHKSGVNYFHILQNKMIDKQSERNKGVKLELIEKPLRVVGASDSFNNIKWNYKIKEDTRTRKTLIFRRNSTGFNPWFFTSSSVLHISYLDSCLRSTVRRPGGNDKQRITSHETTYAIRMTQYAPPQFCFAKLNSGGKVMDIFRGFSLY